MPLSLLHDYRQAYKLSTPSAYSNQYSQMLLSRGIGLRSPTSIAARRGQSSSSARQGVNGSTKNTETQELVVTSENPVEETAHTSFPGASNSPDGGIGRQPRLHSIIGQSRVGKGQLALAVRKHFNSAGLVEQEAIARFLYKVREERKGHQFRLRFQL
jgi:Sin3 binding region of histone deacetylase complex subunit SAP30